MTVEIVLLAACWLLFVPAVVVGSYWYRTRRDRETKEWVAAAGWTYVGTDPSLVDRWAGAPFGTGQSRRASDVMVGRWGDRPVVSFTYSFVTGAGNRRSTVHFHVLALPLPAFLPPLELTPDGAAVRLLTRPGEDIQFESEEFNRAWRVVSADAKFAHDVVHPRLMERLMAPDAFRARLRFAGTDLVSWAPGTTNTVGIHRRLALMQAVIDSVPRYVWQDHGYDPGPSVPGTPTR